MGPHWATGLGVDDSFRTSADGEIWAYESWSVARASVLKNMSASYEDENREDIAAVSALRDGESWHGESNWQITFHDRDVRKCRECIGMDANGWRVEDYDEDEEF